MLLRMKADDLRPGREGVVMSEERLKVLEMVSNGIISAEEGVRLLEALNAGERRSNGHAPQGFFGKPPQTHGRGKVNIELPLPSLKIPKINLGGLGDMYFEMKNSVVDAAKTGYESVKRSKAGKYLELHDYTVDGPEADNVQLCNIKLTAQAASIKLKAAEADSPLMRVEARKVQEQPVLITTISDGVADAALTHSFGRCNLSLHPEPSYHLVLHCAACEAGLDFSALALESLSLDNNAGSIGIELGSRVDQVGLRLRSNAGDLRLKVPADYALSISALENLSASNLERQGLSLVDGKARSTDWETNPKRVDINLEQNVANFSLKWRGEAPKENVAPQGA